MKTFYIVRHGDRKNLPGDPILSELGLLQSQFTARYLKELSSEIVFTSPLKRAFMTAEIIAQTADIPLLSDIRLVERLNWDGKVPIDEFETEWEKSEVDRRYKSVFGSSSMQVGERLKLFLEEKLEKENKDRIVIVTHGGVISDLLVTLFKPEELNGIEADFLSFKSAFIGECSITTLTYGDNGWDVAQIASVSHLKGVEEL